MKIFYKIITALLLCGFFYLQYDLKSDTANIIISDSLKTTDSVKLTSDSLELKKIKLAEGRSLYEKKCQKCHMLYEPKDYKLKQWKENLEEMKEKAELNKDEYSLILGYLSANCKK